VTLFDSHFCSVERYKVRTRIKRLTSPNPRENHASGLHALYVFQVTTMQTLRTTRALTGHHAAGQTTTTIPVASHLPSIIACAARHAQRSRKSSRPLQQPQAGASVPQATTAHGPKGRPRHCFSLLCTLLVTRRTS
jgi:hypothetical protein